MDTIYLLSGIAVMALVTYVIRTIPMVVFRKKITNIYVKSFLYYVPYTVLSAMTFPAIFSSTGSPVTAWVGCIVAVILAFFRKSLLTVAIGSAIAVYICQIIIL